MALLAPPPPPSLTILQLNNGNLTSSPKQIHNRKSIPSHFDCRQKWPGCISDARSQGSCGSCWAFASVTVLGDRFCTMTACDRECTVSTNTINLKSQDTLRNDVDEILGLQKLTLRHIFYTIVLNAHGEHVDTSVLSTPTAAQAAMLKRLDALPCDSDQFEATFGVPMRITLEQWLQYFKS